MKQFIWVCILIVSILLMSCSSGPDVVVQDLSRATPTAAAVADVELEDEGTSSYVKVKESEEQEETIEDYDEDEIEKRVYKEGDLIEFDPVGIDPDGDIITYAYSKPLNSDGSWQTAVGDEGTYLVTITASDGKAEVEKKVLLLILPVNRAPTLDNLDDIYAREGDLITLQHRVFDYNSDDVTLTFSKPFDEDGEWQTDYEDSGTYIVKVTANDGETTTEKQITVIVEEVNRLPELSDIEHVSVFSGETIDIDASATDPDGDTVTIAYDEPLNAEGQWTPTEADLGTYAVSVTASDGIDIVEKIVTIIVNHKNLPPVISIETEMLVEETQRIQLEPTIVDPEGNDFTISYSEPFDADGTWTTDYDSAGIYDVTITATDDEGATAQVTVTIEVFDRNRAPTFTI